MTNTIDYSKCKDPAEFTPPSDGQTPDWFDEENPIEVECLRYLTGKMWIVSEPLWMTLCRYRPADPEIRKQIEAGQTPTPEQIREYAEKLTPEQRKEAGIVLEAPVTNRARFEAYVSKAWLGVDNKSLASTAAAFAYNWLKEQGALKEGWE